MTRQRSARKVCLRAESVSTVSMYMYLSRLSADMRLTFFSIMLNMDEPTCEYWRIQKGKLCDCLQEYKTSHNQFWSHEATLNSLGFPTPAAMNLSAGAVEDVADSNHPSFLTDVQFHTFCSDLEQKYPPVIFNNNTVCSISTELLEDWQHNRRSYARLTIVVSDLISFFQQDQVATNRQNVVPLREFPLHDLYSAQCSKQRILSSWSWSFNAVETALDLLVYNNPIWLQYTSFQECATAFQSLKNGLKNPDTNTSNSHNRMSCLINDTQERAQIFFEELRSGDPTAQELRDAGLLRKGSKRLAFWHQAQEP